ncbi:MAG: zinc-ribbon domain-containing protein [Clostridia bacterium]|nr:zinc-ribbon domain-containing protein [Clostridia bacterium]
MLCKQCGTENSDDSKFCSKCGLLLDHNQTDNLSTEPKTKHKNRKIGIIAIAALTVILLVASVFYGKSYRAVANQYMKATFYKADAKSIFELIPPKMLEYILEIESHEEYELLIENYNESLIETIDYIINKYGKNSKISHKIIQIKEFNDEYFKILKKDYEYFNVNISKAKNIEVQFTIKDGNTEYYHYTNIIVIKVGCFWYLDLEDLRDFCKPIQ